MTQNGEICSMKNMTYNETMREAMAVALLQLMKKKAFAQITISEIIKLAGVSRSSFYRNYASKEEILCQYICTLYREFFQQEHVLLRVTDRSQVLAFLLPRFRFIKEHRDIFITLSQHNMLYYFFRQIESDLIPLLCGQDADISPYYRAMFSGASAGIIFHWIENDFKESEEELARLFITLPDRVQKD